jgi:hypothetical protein
VAFTTSISDRRGDRNAKPPESGSAEMPRTAEVRSTATGGRRNAEHTWERRDVETPKRRILCLKQRLKSEMLRCGTPKWGAWRPARTRRGGQRDRERAPGTRARLKEDR